MKDCPVAWYRWARWGSFHQCYLSGEHGAHICDCGLSRSDEDEGIAEAVQRLETESYGTAAPAAGSGKR